MANDNGQMKAQIIQAIQALATGASPQIKKQANDMIASYIKNNPGDSAWVMQELGRYGYAFTFSADGSVLLTKKPEKAPVNDVSGQQYHGQWSQALTSANNASEAARKNIEAAKQYGINQQRPVDNTNWEDSWTPGNVDEQGNPVDTTKGADSYKTGFNDQGTFYQGTPSNTLNELAGDPNSAWAMYLAQGGPGGRSLDNAPVSQFGNNDFMAAMQLAPYLTGMDPLSSGQGTLQFTNDFMNQGMQSGQYVDPKAIFNQTISSLQGQPVVSQEQGVKSLVDSLQAFMDPTQYRMLKARVDQILNQYLTMNIKGGQQDQQGLLLKMIQQAVGM